MNDIIQGTGASIVKEEYQPCEQHGGAHLTKTTIAEKGSTRVQVTQVKGGETEAHISRGSKIESHYGTDESAKSWLKEQLRGE